MKFTQQSKKIILSLATSLALTMAQADTSNIAYQGVAFNSGAAVVSANIALRFTIYASDGTTVIYQETKSSVATTDKGFFSHQIGSGTPVVVSGSAATYAAITWADGYKLKVEADYANGTSYIDLGTQEFSSSVYALKAKSADSATTTSGNAATATKLETARTIGGVSFDGSANINLPGVNAAGTQSTTGNAATATKLATARTIGGVNFDGSADISLPGVNAAGTQNTTGNAATATKLQTARQLNGVNFDGSANITVPTNLSVTAGTTSGPTINSSSGTNVTLPSASSTASGVVTTGTQTFAGTKTLAGTLLITGTGTNQTISNYNYFTSVSTNIGSQGTSFTNSYSIYASDRIAAISYVAYSDKRIKENIKPIENSITTIKKLKPSSYTKIDKVQYGTGLNYGFIAQELEEVIPEAVTKGDGEVPILKKFDDVAFEEGVTYKILVKDGEEIKEQSYTKGQIRPTGELFVLNKKVHDFRTVDYNMVFSVAVAAIKEQQKTIETLQNEIKEIKTQLNSNKTNN